MDLLSSVNLQPTRRLAPVVPGLVGGLDAMNEAVQAAKNVHILAQSPPPDARPGSKSPPVGHHAPTNGLNTGDDGYLETIVRIALGTITDGVHGSGMPFPGCNASLQTAGTRRVCWKCIAGKWIMTIFGGSDA